ncbi:T-cell-interacting, activating receptor on myeloid cells protein 1-like [Tiliqua scincoides]|uniref:T-cell-interacting, activating receptor on myeloid cells protein 1-like n=1 Tax=Tiliqua scincoides TaxID=71010 RepID=UPI00346260A1
MEKDLNFTLHRFGNPIRMTETGNDTDTAVFTFTSLKVEDGGIYTCEYRRKRNRFVLSELSDRLELNLTDSSLPKPTIELRSQKFPALGRSVTIECRGPEAWLNCSLQQPSISTAFWLSESTENTTRFSLARVRLEDEGNYTCRYHHRDNPFVWSEPSEPVQLNVRALPIVEVSIRLVVAILVLLTALLIAAEAVYSLKKEKEKKKEATLMSPPE